MLPRLAFVSRASGVLTLVLQHDLAVALAAKPPLFLHVGLPSDFVSYLNTSQ